MAAEEATTFDGTLSDNQVAHFVREGWLVVPEFWNTAEIDAMRAELSRLQSDGKLRNVATDGDGATTSTKAANLQLCPMWPHSELFRAMPFAPKVGPAVERLIGGPVVFHLDQVFLKPARHGAGTNWHQDNAYFQIPDPLQGTALWTAVHDATVANGTIRVIGRAFATALPHERDPMSDHHIRCFPDESLAIPIEIKAGGAVFFAYGTPHATGANTTDAERAGVALHFVNANQSGVARGGFAVGARPFVTGPDANGGSDIYGTDVRGDWETLVEAGSDRYAA